MCTNKKRRLIESVRPTFWIFIREPLRKVTNKKTSYDKLDENPFHYVLSHAPIRAAPPTHAYNVLTKKH